MSRDTSPKRGSINSSSSDWEFRDNECGVCEEMALGKTMSRCGECEELICQNCPMHYVGCEHDDEAHICDWCFESVYKQKKKYCLDKTCSCDNKTPQFKAKQENKEKQYDQFVQNFDIAEWKKTHIPINYPSKHRGSYLVDLLLSHDSFQRGYIDWLIANGNKNNGNQYSKEQNENFQRFVAEAKELKQAISNTKLHTYNFRK